MNNVRFGVFFLLAILIAGLVRFSVYRECIDNDSIIKVTSRTQQAEANAATILSGKGFGRLFSPGNQQNNPDDLGFALYVAFLWKIAGIQNTNVIRIGTLLLDIIAMVVLSASIIKVCGQKAGLWTALLYAFYLPAVIESTYATSYVSVLHGTIFLMGLLFFFPRGLYAQIAITVLLACSLLVLDLIRATFVPLTPFLAVTLFIKVGKWQGFFLGTLLVCVTLSGVLILKLLLAASAHPVWHTIFVGLGEGPNPFGIVYLDQFGVAQAEKTCPGANLYTATDQYMEVIKGRSLTLIDESPGFYIRVIGRRLLQVVIGMQNWNFISIGFSKSQAILVTYILFGLAFSGAIVCLKDKIPNSFILFLMYFYFSLIVVPVSTMHPQYFIAGAGMQIPFAGIFLSRLSIKRITEIKTEQADLRPIRHT
ncbi:MAG: hypothetical protein H3C64_13605 [Candidatus Kuenenia stuttgartiensis]|nr:hypothetical protein [bacterium]MBV6481792.1 hypothetical protein [bacterium]MBW7943385.1 hypothetical protein [Candidatus Kuenenia stuttgartiensis]